MEQEIEKLTMQMLSHCGGKNAGVVIGAAFNVAQTALNSVPDKKMLSAVAATLRTQADMVEKMASEIRH